MRILSNSEKTLVIDNKLNVSKNILKVNKLGYLILEANMNGDSSVECENTKDLVSQEDLTDFKPDDLLYIK